MEKLATSLALGFLLLAAGRGIAQGAQDQKIQIQDTPESPESPQTETVQDPRGVSERLLSGIAEPGLRQVLAEVLAGNPEIAAAEARARAAEHRAPQVRALPDPTAAVTAFVSSPETRVGPQRLAVTLSQALPWLSKLADRERMAVWEALALRAEVEAMRLGKLTEARRLWWEIAFLDVVTGIQREKRVHLLQHEEAARARYATGVGESQGVVKLQAEITRVEAELLDLETRRATRVAQVQGLAGRLPGDEPLPLEPGGLPDPPTEAVGTAEPKALLSLAERHRPEIAAADAGLERARVARRLAEKGKLPDFTVGLTYTLVEPRSDLPGRLNPPDRNGEDVVGIQGGVRVPLWRERIAAGVREAAEMETAATEARRGILVGIERRLDDLGARLPLVRKRLALFEEVLLLQAEEALRSAEAGYVSGRFSALDLLDAEHVLFDTRIAAARARADHAIALAELDGEIGTPLHPSQAFFPPLKKGRAHAKGEPTNVGGQLAWPRAGERCSGLPSRAFPPTGWGQAPPLHCGVHEASRRGADHE